MLAALAIETRRRRAGWPVLALLDLAGLLRPEAWLFAGVYWLYLWRGSSPRERAALAALVALAPAAVGALGPAVTGRPLWSLTNTRRTAQRAAPRDRDRSTCPTTARAGSARCSGRTGSSRGALGGVLALWLTRSRALLGAAAGVVAVVAFAIVAAAGLPIQDRYVFLIAAILLRLRRRRPVRLALARRRRSAPPARGRARRSVIAVAILGVDRLAGAALPQDVRRLEAPADQSLVGAAADRRTTSSRSSSTPRRAARRSASRTRRRMPLLALYLHTSPANIVGSARSRRGTYLGPPADAADPYTRVPARPPTTGQHRRERIARRASALVARATAPGGVYSTLSDGSVHAPNPGAVHAPIPGRAHAPAEAREWTVHPPSRCARAVPPPARAPVGELPSRLPAPA